MTEVKSLLGYFSPYVRSLEERIEKAEGEKSKLLDRILHLTTGAPLELPKDAVVAPENPSIVKDAMSKAAEHELEFGGYPTFGQLLQAKESESFREDAGLEPETQLAAIQRSDEELSEEQEKAVNSLKQQFKDNFLRAKEEYLRGAQPIYTAEEKRAQSN
jgi:hypothetical protein